MDGKAGRVGRSADVGTDFRHHRQPVLHDKSNSIVTGAPDPSAEDRQVRYRDGGTGRQRDTVFSAGMSYADTLRYITRLTIDDRRRRNAMTGTVDMRAYLAWLNDNGYGIDMTVQ